MRVIAGLARRLNLKTITGLETRPTTDRIKETLFNMINPDLEGVCFLDLFAGCGQIGIEALSRGAREAVFIENNKAAAACIEENLKVTKLEECASVICQDAFMALKRLENNYVFDYIFMDPPYNKLLEKQILEYLKNSSLIHKTSVIIVEASLETEFEYLQDLGYHIIKRKEYKNNTHMFIELQ
ncbi:MAG: 16S rRNA (guanine(966)-N(2))-methyltransferase RsmD [Lachnotalea sp.]